jgi:hypothetical protein
VGKQRRSVTPGHRRPRPVTRSGPAEWARAQGSTRRVNPADSVTTAVLFRSSCQAAAAKRPLPRTQPLRMRRSTRREGHEAHSSRGDSTSTTAWDGLGRCGPRRHPSAPRACDRAQPRGPRRNDGRAQPTADSDFHYDNA